jgi:DNA repair photolyase
MSTIQASLFEPPVAAINAPESFGRASVKALDVGSILTPTKGRGKLGEFDFSLNPYRGCGFGCSYCYAAFFVPDEDRRSAWGEWVEVKSNAVRLLERQRDLAGKLVLMSSATDPYQPLESSTGLTRAILEHLASREDQPRLVVQTRGPLVTRDIDLFQKFRDVRVNITVSTDSDTIRKRFEPACASIERRLAALRELKGAGIRIGVSIAPMLPIEDPIAFARTLRELQADCYWSAYFHTDDRMFASNTREGAMELAREYAWTEDKYRRTRAVLESLVPGFGSLKAAVSKAA